MPEKKSHPLETDQLQEKSSTIDDDQSSQKEERVVHAFHRSGDFFEKLLPHQVFKKSEWSIFLTLGIEIAAGFFMGFLISLGMGRFFGWPKIVSVLLGFVLGLGSNVITVRRIFRL